jgi:hypothetical protein
LLSGNVSVKESICVGSVGKKYAAPLKSSILSFAARYLLIIVGG